MPLAIEIKSNDVNYESYSNLTAADNTYFSYFSSVKNNIIKMYLYQQYNLANEKHPKWKDVYQWQIYFDQISIDLTFFLRTNNS